jgi:hypothetical protein
MKATPWRVDYSYNCVSLIRVSLRNFRHQYLCSPSIVLALLWGNLWIQLHILFCVFHRSFYQLKAYHLFGHFAQAYADGSCSAANIEHHSLCRNLEERSDFIQHFLKNVGVHLEEGVWRNFELEAKHLFSVMH